MILVIVGLVAVIIAAGMFASHVSIRLGVAYICIIDFLAMLTVLFVSPPAEIIEPAFLLLWLWYIAVFTFAGATTGVLLAWLMPKMYRVSAG